MARLLSDGVCKRLSARRPDGVLAPEAGHRLVARALRQCACLATTSAFNRRRPAGLLNESLGFRLQPEFLSVVVGKCPDNDANR